MKYSFHASIFISALSFVNTDMLFDLLCRVRFSFSVCFAVKQLRFYKSNLSKCLLC
jgi:hypothetical protein